jgi:geranylgeranyl diphosphate synthase type II
MITLQKAQKIISDKINSIHFTSEPIELYKPISYIFKTGGKRIRPAITLLGCNLFSEDVEPAVNPAIALEIFHNFSLVHDDIMDKANVRRGKQTIHSKWNDNVAILSGDAMCIKAYDYICDSDPRYLKKVMVEFNNAAIKVCEGQQFDMNFETRQIVSEAEYLKMIELKTSVLLAACLKIGAITGGATDKDADFLYDFGLNLGMAFQLQDDLLDVFGDEQMLGKEIGKDIISNKKTFLLIKALETAKASQLDSLKKWINLKTFDPEEKIKAIQVIYLGLGIKEITLKAIEGSLIKALEDLKKVSVEEDRKLELKNFLFSIRNRKY